MQAALVKYECRCLDIPDRVGERATTASPFYGFFGNPDPSIIASPIGPFQIPQSKPPRIVREFSLKGLAIRPRHD